MLLYRQKDRNGNTSLFNAEHGQESLRQEESSRLLFVTKKITVVGIDVCFVENDTNETAPAAGNITKKRQLNC